MNKHKGAGFLNYNCNKESIEINLKTNEGLKIVHQLMQKSEEKREHNTVYIAMPPTTARHMLEP